VNETHAAGNSTTTQGAFEMAVDGVGSATAAAASSNSSDTVSDADWAKFEQAFLDAMPQAASFMLMTIGQDAAQEVASMGDEQDPNSGP
jgi:hypothetical protein